MGFGAFTAQGVHRRSLSYSVNSRQSASSNQYQYPQLLTVASGTRRRDDGSGDNRSISDNITPTNDVREEGGDSGVAVKDRAYFVTHNDLRTCRGN